jgi:hypothetical protein
MSTQSRSKAVSGKASDKRFNTLRDAKSKSTASKRAEETPRAFSRGSKITQAQADRAVRRYLREQSKA